MLLLETLRPFDALAFEPAFDFDWLVIGSGFGGLFGTKALRRSDVEVTMLAKTTHHLFQPLLYQVATGGLNPGDVTYALRAYASRYRNTTFRRAAVTGVDPVAHLVHLDEGSPLPYDYLIVSTGVATNYFGIPGAAAHSITIYTRAGAIAARDRVLTALERVFKMTSMSSPA